MTENWVYIVICWEDKFIHSVQKNREIAQRIKKSLEESMGWDVKVVEVYYGD